MYMYRVTPVGSVRTHGNEGERGGRRGAVSGEQLAVSDPTRLVSTREGKGSGRAANDCNFLIAIFGDGCTWYKI